MSNDIEQFKKWLDAFMTVSAMAGIEDHEVVPTWPHYSDKEKEMFKDYPQLTAGAVRALADQLEDLQKTAAALLVAQERAAKAEDHLKTMSDKARKLCLAVENDDELPPVKYALRAGRLVNEVKDLISEVQS